jgi:hypothetical protein
MENQLVTTEEKQDLSMQNYVEQNRAAQEVQAALVIAKKFPRDEMAAYKRIMSACKRTNLAEQAIYSLPIGGTVQRGPSIRLAEVLAQAWGNLKFGFKEYERINGKSNCVAFCHDLETNTNSEMTFEVEHWIETGKKGQKVIKAITDPAEIDRLVANRGSKKLRNCILKVIPPDIIDDALKACRDTVAKGDNSPLTDRVRQALVKFEAFAITQKMIEERLGHSVDVTTPEEFADLVAIYKSLVDKQATRADFFKTGETDTPTVSPLAEALKKNKEERKDPEVKAETKAEEPKKEPPMDFLRVRAGDMVGKFWKEYAQTPIKEIPQDELLEKLAAMEKTSHQFKLTEDEANFYNSACTFLARKRNLKA